MSESAVGVALHRLHLGYLLLLTTPPIAFPNTPYPASTSNRR
jgi:hypothetical protein